ncbi:MAG: CooT family nickel-binding protein [Clostridiales bacterium]
MCEANAYILENGVDRLVPNGAMRMMANVFGGRTFIRACIKELALVAHKIILEQRM